MSAKDESKTAGHVATIGTATMSEAKRILTAVALSKPRHPIMLRGRHGIGKSECVYQMAKELASYFGLESLPVVERRASQMTEGDLLGVPDREGLMVPPFGEKATEANSIKASTFNPPDWYAQAMQGPCILFLDEVDRAPMEVRQGLFEICDSRKIAGKRVHEDCVIIAAINGGLHAANYHGVNDLDRAELSRYFVVDLEPTQDEWFMWAQSIVAKPLYDFLQANRGHLEHIGSFDDPNKVFPDRRGWHWLDQTLKAANVWESSRPNMTLVTLLATAKVGIEAAQGLVAYLGNYKFQVKPEEIFVDGKFGLLDKWEMNDYATFVSSCEDFLKKDMSDSVAKNVNRFIREFVPEELAVGMFVTATQSNFENMIKIGKDDHVLAEKLANYLRKTHATEIRRLASEAGVELDENFDEIVKGQTPAEDSSSMKKTSKKKK